MPRDYAAEMRKIIDAEKQDGDTAADVALRIVEKLRAVDPDLLAGWLDLGAVTFVREAIGVIGRSSRSAARASERPSAFARDAERGDVSRWLDAEYVIEGDARRKLRDLRAPDLAYVAESYEDRAAANRMEAAFFRALAMKVGDGCVSDHFTEKQIAAMRKSIA